MSTKRVPVTDIIDTAIGVCYSIEGQVVVFSVISENSDSPIQISNAIMRVNNVTNAGGDICVSGSLAKLKIVTQVKIKKEKIMFASIDRNEITVKTNVGSVKIKFAVCSKE